MLVIKSLSMYILLVSHLFLSKYLINDRYIYLLLVYFSSKQVYQNFLLITDVYICYQTTFLIDKSIIYQNAKKKHLLLYYLKDVLIKLIFLAFSSTTL